MAAAMASQLPPGAPPPLASLMEQGRVALFLDFDGTLVGIAPEPGAIDVPPDLASKLYALEERLGGRLALITGRALDDLESHLGEVSLCRAGSHGASRMRRDGSRLGEAPHGLPDEAVTALRDYAATEDLYYETKTHGGALHFRGKPDRAESTIAFARKVAAAHDLCVTSGKGVAELVRPGANKGGAVRAFMAEDPFAGATPIFVGDDVTDEDGMAAAIEFGGFGIAVGERHCEIARYALANVATVHQWLDL